MTISEYQEQVFNQIEKLGGDKLVAKICALGIWPESRFAQLLAAVVLKDWATKKTPEDTALKFCRDIAEVVMLACGGNDIKH